MAGSAQDLAFVQSPYRVRGVGFRTPPPFSRRRAGDPRATRGRRTAPSAHTGQGSRATRDRGVDRRPRAERGRGPAPSTRVAAACPTLPSPTSAGPLEARDAASRDLASEALPTPCGVGRARTGPTICSARSGTPRPSGRLSAPLVGLVLRGPLPPRDLTGRWDHEGSPKAFGPP